MQYSSLPDVQHDTEVVTAMEMLAGNSSNKVRTHSKKVDTFVVFLLAAQSL